MKPEYRIIPLETQYLQAAMTLVWDVFTEFEAPDYSLEGVAEFREYIAYPAMKVRMESGELFLWGCVLGEKIVGVLAMRKPWHVSLLFVDKTFHRQGIARALYKAMLAQWEDRATGIVTVNSSPYAEKAYEKLGFVKTGEEQTVNGLRFIPMVHQVV